MQDSVLGFDLTSSKAIINCSNGTCLVDGLSLGDMGRLVALSSFVYISYLTSFFELEIALRWH